jgi:hypothetical protein
MKYPAEMSSGATIYIQHFTKTGSGIKKLTWGDTHRQHGDRISLLLLFQNKESRVRIKR